MYMIPALTKSILSWLWISTRVAFWRSHSRVASIQVYLVRRR